MPRQDLIQVRGGTAAEWASENPTLALREPGVETDTRRIKIGDGTTSYADLPYATIPINPETSTATTRTLSATGAGFQVFTGTSAATWTLCSAADALKLRIKLTIKNAGSAALTVQRAGSDTIFANTSVTSVTLAVGDSIDVRAYETTKWAVC